jgi:glycosyltransferase involved in cell wall biosynthesis
LTVTVITYNEGPHIVEALQSVSWADEIILVDSHSTDDTVERRISPRMTGSSHSMPTSA